MKQEKTLQDKLKKVAQFSCVALCTIAITGCQKDNEEVAAPEAVAPVEAAAVAPVAAPVAAPSTIPAGNPKDVLAEVDGEKLTRGEVEKEIDIQMTALQDRIPPERKTEFRDGMYKYTVEQFVVKQLLINEAKKQKIKVTKADKEKVYEQIKASLPPGKTIEQAMEESPLGKKRMEEEIQASLTITKLIEKEMEDKVSVSKKEIAAFKSDPVKVTASHILIMVDPADSAEVKAEKKAKAEKIQKELAGGADFAKLAAEHSACPSKAKGGDLGPFGRGQMAPPFEEASFTQEVDVIGPVVETQFGYHIIKVTAQEKGDAVPEEEIKKMLESEKQREVASNFIDALRKKAKITYAKGFEPPPAL